jgi:hypothetical protein
MAAPIITGTVPASPLVFSPGETKQIRILASDPDNGPAVSQRFVVSDLAGNQTPITVTLQVQDTLTYSADAAPTGWVITQSPTDPAVFSVKAP